MAEEVKRKKERKAVLKRATSQRCHQRPFGFTWRDNYERARKERKVHNYRDITSLKLHTLELAFHQTRLVKNRCTK